MPHTAVPDATADEASPRERPRAAGAWPLRLLTLAGIVGFAAVAMGSSLVGLRTLTVPDQLNAHEPWRSEQTQDWTFEGTWFGDHVNVILPATHEFADRLRDGDLAMWSTFSNGGAPLASIGDVSVFSPPTWPFLVMPLWLAPAWAHLAVMGVAIGGMVAFLRRLGVSAVAGAVGGLAFATSGFMYIWINWPHTRVAAFIPWMFWAVERGLQEGRRTLVVPLALATALLYVGGFPAVTAYALGASGLYALFRLAQMRRAGADGREVARLGGLSAAGVILGLGLVAWLVLPLGHHLGGLDLDYREQTTECHAPTRSLASLIFPRYGSDAAFEFVCPTGEHETEGFAGALVLGLAALGSAAPGRRRRGHRTFFLVVAAGSAMLAYGGGPALWLVQQLPVFETNRIMRIRVLLSFALAVLAAFGVDHLRANVGRPVDRRLLAGVAVLMAGLALIAWTIHDWPDIPDPPLGGWIPLVACVVAGAVFLAARARKAGPRFAALALVPLLVAAEAAAAIQPYWPTGDPDDLYAATSTTRFLQDHLGRERFVSTEYTLEPSAHAVYRLRGVTGRTFYEDVWGDVLAAVNGRRLGPRSLSLVPHLPVERVRSPLLDRLSARYYVTDAGNPVYGEVLGSGPPLGRTELRPDEPVLVPLDGPVRAIGLELPVAPDPGGERPRVEVELLDAGGRVLATGSQRMFPWIRSGPWHAPVAGDGAGGTVAARLTLTDAERPVVVNRYAGGVAAYLVAPADDGLRLVHAEATAIYERPSALPRVRWASDAVVETDAERRLALLAGGTIPGSTVVLSEPGPAASGEPAAVDVVADAGETVRAVVEADGDGYLVVADAIQRGWRATVDGEPAELRAADHAVVAVAVPEGRHVVELSYAPPGQRTGLGIAAGSAVVLGAIAFSSRLAAGRRSGSRGRSSPGRG